MIRLLCLLLMAAPIAVARAETVSIVLQSTTSTENSGLLDHLLPQFERGREIDVRVVAVGTGQALENTARGDGDVVLAHAPEAERAFVEAGHGVERFDVMYNDFVIVGPSSDPAGVRDARSLSAGLRAIAEVGAPFASRADESGTHRKEMALWKASGVDAAGAARSWRREVGAGMGAVLNLAAGMNAYALTDRATWIAFANKRELEIVFEGDPSLANPYGVIQATPRAGDEARANAAATFVEWLIGPEGQAAIDAFRVDGQQVFFASAGAKP